MLQHLAAIAIATSLSLLPAPARAWGNEGHEIVALIAYKHLTPAVRTKVDALLKADKDTLTKTDIASRATWADRYRDSDRNTTHVRYDLTHEWHFVDIEIDHSDLAAACFSHPPAATPASQGPAKSCVVDRIDAFSAELRQLKASDPERTLAFKFLLHFVGDVHQPLHAADHNDKGGNSVHVLFGKHVVGQPLHSYWDTDAVERLGTDPTKAAAAAEKRYGTKCSGWMQGTPADWAMESFGIARDVVYKLGTATTDEHGEPAFELSATYQTRAGTVAAQQLEKAGCRLAMVLNAALK